MATNIDDVLSKLRDGTLQGEDVQKFAKDLLGGDPVEAVTKATTFVIDAFIDDLYKSDEPQHMYRMLGSALHLHRTDDSGFGEMMTSLLLTSYIDTRIDCDFDTPYLTFRRAFAEKLRETFSDASQRLAENAGADDVSPSA